MSGHWMERIEKLPSLADEDRSLEIMSRPTPPVHSFTINRDHYVHAVAVPHFDQSPRPLEKSTYGYVYCSHCDAPVDVAGHDCVVSCDSADGDGQAEGDLPATVRPGADP